MSLIPTGANHLARALQNGNKPMTLLYNDGDAYFRPNSNQNVAVYNAPGASVTFLGEIKCASCNQTFDSQSEKRQHDEFLPYTCSQHYDCFDSWSTHVQEYAHTKCPISSCAKAGQDFGSDSRFMQHFRNKH